jgi:hypothetical protein
MAEQPKGFIPLPEIPEKVESASHAYSVAFELARAGDVLGWRQLIKRIKPGIFDALVQWRENELDGQRTTNNEELVKVVNKAVEIISPLISVALVWGEAGREQFSDQESTLNDLQNIPGWNRAGSEFWVDIPYALGYVYHSVHGSLSLSTNQLDLALSLAQVEIPIADEIAHSHVWKMPALMGWSELFGSNCVEGWKYLAKAYEKWDWLSAIFGDESEYRTSLVAYYMALSIHELASIIASGQQDILKPGSIFYFNVPLTFVSEEQDVNQSAVLLLRRSPEALKNLWTSLNVTREQMQHTWRDWIRLSELWLREVYGPSFYTRVFHQNLFEGV